MANTEQEDRTRLQTMRELKQAHHDIERLVSKLQTAGTYESATYLRKAATELKKAMRAL